MKKIFALLVLVIAGLVFVACKSTYEIAMITDTGDIDDGSFNQGTWEGIKEFAKANKKTHKYYKPAGENVSDYVAAIDLAVAGGAKIVITPGFYFEVPIHTAQTKYPDVKFVILDGNPHSGDYTPDIKNNTLSIFFKEEQAAFLAGYATVKEGLRTLGFMGGIAVPAVVRFGIGYVSGAYHAAKEEGITDFSFEAINYDYLGNFSPSDEFKTKASTWFNRGVQIIHAAAGGAGNSVMAAAQELTGKWVVGVDSDQANDSNSVLTSAMKGVGQAAYDALTAFYADEFPGGETWNLGAADQAVGLPMETSRFQTFTKTQYDAIFAKLVDGTVVAPTTDTELGAFITALGYTVPAGLLAKVRGE